MQHGDTAQARARFGDRRRTDRLVRACVPGGHLACTTRLNTTRFSTAQTASYPRLGSASLVSRPNACSRIRCRDEIIAIKHACNMQRLTNIHAHASTELSCACIY
jgi:hypothetical protein